MVANARELDDREQAVFFHARERRRSLAGVPELNRTHRLFGPSMAVADIATGDIFPNRDTPVVFQTALRRTTGTPSGLVFEFGDSTTAAALWIDDDTIAFHAGDAGTVNGATASLTQAATIPEGLELDIVASVRPGDGRVRLWGNGRELSRAQASGLSLPNGWAAASNGSFAAAVQGTVVADVTQSGAPIGFDVIEPLSVYMGQFPRHFV